MQTPFRFVCPDIDMPKEERAHKLFQDIECWINSAEMSTVVSMFGGTIPNSLSLKEKIDFLNNFARIWDYRNRDGKFCERWSICDNTLDARKTEIMNCVAGLGFIKATEPTIVPDYILPLGGARTSNLTRAQYAFDLINHLHGQPHKVVALGSMRPIDDIERIAIDSYAPDASTEYEALCAGMETTFSLKNTSFDEQLHLSNNPNLSWALRKYFSAEVYVAAAPSLRATRRASSMDTFNFFVNQFNVEKGTKVLLITSNVYVLSQFFQFMQIALKHDLIIDCIGTPNSLHSITLSPAHYLQELQTAIASVKTLAEKYL